jgi:hypothetical protein
VIGQITPLDQSPPSSARWRRRTGAANSACPNASSLKERQASSAEFIPRLECSLRERASLTLARSEGGRSELKMSCSSRRC